LDVAENCPYGLPLRTKANGSAKADDEESSVLPATMVVVPVDISIALLFMSKANEPDVSVVNA
jgi:hypothetical protein